MDIERLTARNKNGLAYLVKVKPNEQEVDSPYKNTLKCILDCFERLAQYEEEAIARQSATSEEVAEAIKRFEKRNNRLKEVQDNGDAGCVDIETWEKYQGFIEDNNLAITALQAYQPKGE